jgi:hypothetical protein
VGRGWMVVFRRGMIVCPSGPEGAAISQSEMLGKEVVCQRVLGSAEQVANSKKQPSDHYIGPLLIRQGGSGRMGGGRTPRERRGLRAGPGRYSSSTSGLCRARS